MDRRSTRCIGLLLCVALVTQLASCGTLLYPERRGQKSGQIDTAVVIMDAIGVLFFVIPGLLAFAVDFHTGAIYLPPGNGPSKGKRKKAESPEAWTVVRLDPARLDPETIAATVRHHTGLPFRLDDPRLIVRKIEDRKDFSRVFESFPPQPPFADPLKIDSNSR